MHSAKLDKAYSWCFVAAGAVTVLAGSFLAWLEGAFVESWMYDKHANLSSIATGAATLFLLIGLILLRSSQQYALRLIAISAAAAALCVVVFLVQISPVAQGNNDSGEVFWPVVLPGILLATYGFWALLSDRQLRTSR